MHTAFDEAAALSERPLPVLLGLAQRWLSNTFTLYHISQPLSGIASTSLALSLSSRMCW
jgi:hypothetical protein